MLNTEKWFSSITDKPTKGLRALGKAAFTRK